MEQSSNVFCHTTGVWCGNHFLLKPKCFLNSLSLSLYIYIKSIFQLLIYTSVQSGTRTRLACSSAVCCHTNLTKSVTE